MKKGFILILSYVLSFNIQASVSIPYCPGTEMPSPSKHQALQSVVREYAHIYHCRMGNHCLLNFDVVKYSISWVDSCDLNSTFVCSGGACYPLGYSYPIEDY